MFASSHFFPSSTLDSFCLGPWCVFWSRTCLLSCLQFPRQPPTEHLNSNDGDCRWWLTALSFSQSFHSGFHFPDFMNCCRCPACHTIYLVVCFILPPNPITVLVYCKCHLYSVTQFLRQKKLKGLDFVTCTVLKRSRTFMHQTCNYDFTVDCYIVGSVTFLSWHL